MDMDIRISVGICNLLIIDLAEPVVCRHRAGITQDHAELLESCPVYKEIYESQFKKGDAQK